ncbi:MAG: hypothetical protein QNJ57_08520 [Flavobacteriaceae bacterium]|nr:hypothetical protein [Flavobacteriaceae bacterium]
MITFLKEFLDYFYAILKQLFTPYIYIVLFLWSFQQLNAQSYTLKILENQSTENPIFNKLKFQQKHQNIKSIFREVDSLQIKLERFGYLDNRLDSLTNKDSIYTAHFFLGNSIKRVRVIYDHTILTKADVTRYVKEVTDDYFEVGIEEVPQILNSLVGVFEQQGKLFTSINLKDILLQEDHLVAKLSIKISKERTIDKVIVSGYEKFPKSFLKHFLDVHAGTTFNNQKITNISERAKSLPFVSESKPSEVLFTKDSTFLYLYLKKERANRFDGLVGFTSDETNDGLDFNGYLDLELNNVLNGGENIRLNWRNNGNDRQIFNFETELPYIFNSSVTPSFGLNIYRQDSTFINTNLNLKLSYLINYRNKIGLVLNSTSSDNLLDNPIENVVNFSTTQYGLSYDYRISNNSILFPVKFYLNAQAALGSRRSEGNTTNQFLGNLLANYLWSFNFKNHLFIQNETSFLNSDNYITNELFRIGGVNSIRGFNEESIFASLYSIVNLEYRYNPNNSSYIYTISDGAFIRNQLSTTSEQIFSLGLGYAFSTNFGLLNLSYAIGKFNSQDFDFNNSRLHLKIVSFF